MGQADGDSTQNLHRDAIMDVFVARQPIFNREKAIFAYELLFRNGDSNSFPDVDGDTATTSLLSSSFFTVGIDEITDNKRAFINFTDTLLKDGTPQLFSKDKIVVEILEDVVPTREILEACRKLKENGYQLALDDFVYSSDYKELLRICDIIKVDFRSMSPEGVEKLMVHMQGYSCKLLAEKIETYDDFNRAERLGFDYFQGYFFSKPEILKNKDLSSSQLTIMQLITQLNSKDFDRAALESILVQDVSVSYKLINYLNSPHFGRLQPVSSLREAISFLGDKDFRRFATLIATSKLSNDKPNELIRHSIIRARFLELTALELEENSSELFLLGLFSLVDAILDKKVKDILAKLPVSEKIHMALLEKKGPLYPFLRFIESYETGNWRAFEFVRRTIALEDSRIVELYIESVKWADSYRDLRN